MPSWEMTKAETNVSWEKLKSDRSTAEESSSLNSAGDNDLFVTNTNSSIGKRRKSMDNFLMERMLTC